MLQLVASNNLDALATALIERLRALPPLPPAHAETIVIGAKGMDRWLSYKLASHFGVWANPYFPFPEHFAQEIFAPLAQAEAPGQNLFLPDVLPWAIAQRLPRLAQEQPDNFAPVRAYLTNDPGGEKLLGLSQELARIFARYAARRHDSVEQKSFWRFEHGAWQEPLWRELVAASAPGPGTPLHVGLRLLAQRRIKPEAWPSRVHVFGFSSAPRAFMLLYKQLAEVLDIFFYALAPTPLFLGDQVKKRGGLRAGQHRLLANLGRQAAEFQELAETVWQLEADDRFIEPKTPNTLLSQIQADLYFLRDPADPDYKNNGGGFRPWRQDDLSLTLHACHGPAREVEVLRDELLRAFATLDNLQSEEVVVMLPDVERYAPLIHAVFGGGSEPRLKYAVADRKSADERPLAAAFLALLDLLQSRLPADKVLDWLERPPAMQKFGLADSDRSALRSLIVSAKIHWGLDQAHVSRLGLPDHAFTWQKGLNRLLLGNANNARPLAGMFADLAAANCPLEARPALKALVDFCDMMADALPLTTSAKTPAAWADLLQAWLSHFIAVANADAAGDADAIREALLDMAQSANAGGFAGQIGLEVVSAWLSQRLDASSPAWRFLSGGITFCALTPLRNIPFRVVALLGLDAASFPRLDRQLAFDALGQERQLGDPSKQDDDRATFLEAILAAQERLIVTFSGYDTQSNKELPPSTLVAELLDLAESYGAPRQQVCRRHYLHNFDPRYFAVNAKDARSFDANAAQAASAQAKAKAAAASFWPENLLLDFNEKETNLETLIKALSEPVKHLLQQRLNLRLNESENSIDAAEPFELNGLQKFELGQSAVTELLAGQTLATLAANMTAAAMLPPGQLGPGAFAKVADNANALVAAAKAAGWNASAFVTAELTFELAHGPLRLVGVRQSGNAIVRVDYGRFDAKRLLKAWLQHLFANCFELQETILLTRPEKDSGVATARWTGLPTPQAKEWLSDLLEVYVLAARRPLAFDAKTAWKYLESEANGANGVNAARKYFYDNFNAPAPCDDLYIQKIWGQILTFESFSVWQGGEWRNLAKRVLGPLREQMQGGDE